MKYRSLIGVQGIEPSQVKPPSLPEMLADRIMVLPREEKDTHRSDHPTLREIMIYFGVSRITAQKTRDLLRKREEQAAGEAFQS